MRLDDYSPEAEDDYTGRHGRPRDVLVAIDYALTFEPHWRVITGEGVANVAFCRREINGLYRDLYHPRGLMAGVNFADRIKRNRRIWGEAAR